MARHLHIYSLALAIFATLFLTGTATGKPSIPPRRSIGKAHNFLIQTCNASLYPSECLSSLSSYVSFPHMNARRLAIIATSTALSATKNATDFLYKLRKMTSGEERTAITDCLTALGESTDHLRDAVLELQQFRRHGCEMQLGGANSNIGSALTGQSTCVDGFEEIVEAGHVKDGKVKRVVDTTIAGVKKHTSVALALEKAFADSLGS